METKKAIEKILDRDEPMTKIDVINEFKRLTGRLPNKTEINEMAPDTEKTAQARLKELE